MSKKPPEKPAKRPYTMSEKALAQRRGAAFKTGEHAELAANQLGHPCKPSLCPAGEPCEIRRKVEADGGALSTCVVDLATRAEHVEAFRRAIEAGDLEALATIQATLLGSTSSLAVAELERLLEEGLASEITVTSASGDVVSRLAQNPRAEPLIKLLKLVGATAADQQVTPRSRSEGELAGAQVSTLEWMREMHAATEGQEKG